MKTIGIRGGFGPQATMDLEARIHRVAQRLIPPNFNGGYPPLFVQYCRHPPILVDEHGALAPPLRPDPRLLEAAKRLGALVDLLAIPSNGVHAFRQEIEQASGRPVVSMIEATLAELQRRGWRRVGVLGLGEPVIYLRPLERLGIACEIIDGPLREALDRAIFRLMEGRDDDQTAAASRAAVAALRARDVDGVILGCTELPLLLREAVDEADLVNPGALLAEAVVNAAMA